MRSKKQRWPLFSVVLIGVGWRRGGTMYLSDVDPVAYDQVCGLWLSLCPLQVVGVVVSFENPDRVRCVKVEFGVVGLGYSEKDEQGINVADA